MGDACECIRKLVGFLWCVLGVTLACTSVLLLLLIYAVIVAIVATDIVAIAVAVSLAVIVAAAIIVTIAVTISGAVIATTNVTTIVAIPVTVSQRTLGSSSGIGYGGDPGIRAGVSVAIDGCGGDPGRGRQMGEGRQSRER